MMAAFDIFEITVTGRGAHAACHLGIEPVVAAAQIVTGLQTVPAAASTARGRRRQRHPDPQRRHLEHDPRQRGAARHHPVVRPPCAMRSNRRSAGSPNACASLGATIAMRYERRYPPPSTAGQTERRRTTRDFLVGGDNVAATCCPTWGGGFLFLEIPGAYLDRQQRRRGPGVRTTRITFQRRIWRSAPILGPPRLKPAESRWTDQDKPHGDHRARYAPDRQDLTAAGFTMPRPRR
jgi:hypothetical protein